MMDGNVAMVGSHVKAETSVRGSAISMEFGDLGWKCFDVWQFISYIAELTKKKVHIMDLLVGTPRDGSRHKTWFDVVYDGHSSELAGHDVSPAFSKRSLLIKFRLRTLNQSCG